MTTLIVCPALEDAWILDDVLTTSRQRLVVASDDPRVHKRCQERGLESDWMEDASSLYRVADRVKAVIREVNAWFSSIEHRVPGLPEGILFWPQHVEGGFTTQRVQDAFMLADAFGKLIVRHAPRAIVIAASRRFSWEATVVQGVAKHAGITATISERTWRDRWRGRIYDWWQTYAREPYRMSFVVRAKLWPSDRQAAPVDVVVQLCDSAAKHREQAKEILLEFKAQGWRPRAACWRAPLGAANLRASGLVADELEGWIDWSDVVHSASRALRAWRFVRSRRQEFLAIPSLTHERLHFGECLWPSIRFSCLADLPDRLRLDAACRRYFATFQPKAIRFWTTVLPQGVIAWRSLPDTNKPIIFHTPGFPYDRIDPYDHRVVPVDVELAVSRRHQTQLGSRADAARRIAVIGHDRMDVVRRYAQSFSQDASRQALGIAGDAGLVVFYDSGQVMRGYLSAKEQMLTTTALLAFARQHQSATFLIKPHPSHTPGSLESQISAENLSNVRLIPPCDPPYAGLSAADVIVTKRSTIGIEAMYFGRPVIATNFDGEPHFREFGDAAEYVSDPDELREALVGMLDPKRREQHLRLLHERIQHHIRELVDEQPWTAAKMTALAVIEAAA